MTIQQLKYAEALAKHLNFSKAAKSLGISQPALTFQMQKLEQDIGFAIADRSSKQINITAKGAKFLERSRLLINESEQLQTLADELKNEKSGILKIGIIPTLAPYLLPLFIDQLANDYPDLRVHIQEALTHEIIDELKSGTLHGGIISTPISSKVQFKISPLFYEKFMLFVSHENPLFNQAIIDLKHIPLQDIRLLKEGNCFRDQVNHICNFQSTKDQMVPFYFESTSIESLCRIVEFKGGITFLPELSTMHLSAEREDMIKELKGSPKVREVSLIHLPNHIQNKNLVLVAGLIQDNLPTKMLEPKRGQKIPTNIDL